MTLNESKVVLALHPQSSIFLDDIHEDPLESRLTLEGQTKSNRQRKYKDENGFSDQNNGRVLRLKTTDVSR